MTRFLTIAVAALCFGAPLRAEEPAKADARKPEGKRATDLRGYVDRDGDGVNDRFRDANGDGVNDVTGKPYPHRFRVVDANEDGVNDLFVDRDGDGVNDLDAAYVDRDGDGICDNVVDYDGDGVNDIISALFVVGTLTEIQPFHSVIATHEDIKDYWEGTSARAPVAHAEDLRLDAFAQHIDMSVDAVVASLNSRGIEVADREMEVGEIARAHGMTPSALYEMVRPAGGRRGNPGAGYTEGTRDYSEQGHTPGGGFGFGRMTLAEYCASQGMAVETSIARLKERGVQATGQSTMRDLAGALKVTPREVTQLVRK